MTRYAEVIGDPIAQSKSPAIHGFWLGKLGMAAEYRACRVDVPEVRAYLDSRRADPDWLGCNVTMPLKLAVQDHLDTVDPTAAAIGAVNTIHRDGGQGLLGANTDAAGFLEPLRDALDRQHLFRMARIIGTGGAARSIVHGLAQQGFTLVLAGRDPHKARALLDELAPQGEHHAIDLNHFAAATDFAFDDRAGCLDFIVNASPLGMRGQPPLGFDWSHAPPGAVAYDIVTNPLDTPFLAGARARGHRSVDGLAMLIGQAALAFERFFGVAPPRGHDDELRRLLTA